MRRILFAAPFVTTIACHREPPAGPAEPASVAGDWHLPPLRDAAPPPPDAPAGADADPSPGHGVGYGSLVPLHHISECPPHVLCNPPHPTMSGDSTTARPVAIVTDNAGARVRTEIVDSAMTKKWRAHFVAADGTALPHGRCKIVDVGIAEFDCITHRAPRELVDDVTGATHDLVIERPGTTPEAPDPDEPTPPPRTRFVKTEVTDGGILLTIPVGSEHGLTKDMLIQVLSGTTDRLLPGGFCSIIRIDKRATLCLARLTPDQLAANPKLQISPP